MSALTSSLTGKAKKAGVIGWPVGHSKSPALHGFWLREHGVDGTYVALAVRPEDLAKTLKSLAKDGFVGANLTVPHKEAALALVDEVSDIAKAIGAINTVFVKPDGTLSGTNTDAYGFIENLRQNLASFDAARGPAVVLGAGGAARAVCAALKDAGCTQIRVVNRTISRADSLVKNFAPAVTGVAWSALDDAMTDAALLINATSLGMTGQPGLSVDLTSLPRNAVVTDLVYAPLETELLKSATARGNPVVDGLGMLLYQAQAGFEGWFGVKPRVTPALRAHVLASSTS